jgi:hypothetical protein
MNMNINSIHNGWQEEDMKDIKVASTIKII